MPVDRAVRIAALDEGRLRDRLDGYLNFGWSAAAANDLSQLSLGAGVSYRDEIRQRVLAVSREAFSDGHDAGNIVGIPVWFV